MIKLWKKYSHISIDDDIDLVLIDGRFRVVTLLNLYDKIKPDTNILFHDYTTRVGYHILETFYDKIECVDSLQVFKKRENIDRELLKKYSLEYELVID